MTCVQTNCADVRAPEPRRDWALFLDIDGTLIDIAATPDAVVVPDTLPPILLTASEWLGGALAIVSGRTLEQIDHLMRPLRLPCAGEHGAVLRLPDGRILRAGAGCIVSREWKGRLRAAVDTWDGVIVDDKTYGIAVHFRQAPNRESDIRYLVESIVAEKACDFEILPARMAFEIRHRSLNKGVAVRRFLCLPPFLDRTPVFVGDDVTDEDGFSAAREGRGLALHVREAFGGRPANVRRWLQTFQPITTG